MLVCHLKFWSVLLIKMCRHVAPGLFAQKPVPLGPSLLVLYSFKNKLKKATSLLLNTLKITRARNHNTVDAELRVFSLILLEVMH